MASSISRQRPGYGQGTHSIDADLVDEFLVDATEVAGLVRSVLLAPDYQPPLLPAAAMEVHRLSMKRDVDFKAVLGVIEQDQVLASGVLRTCQSPAFARKVPPATLADAVARLGLGNIRDIVYRVAFGAKVFRAPGYTEVMESIRAHSVATAKVARLLARGTPVEDYAYLCGLLHDVGAAAIVIALSESGRKVSPTALITVLSSMHEEAGLVLLRAWDLPEQLGPAISAHHGPVGREGALALVAHTVASELGQEFSIEGSEVESVPPPRLDAARKVLRLSDDGFDRLCKKAATELAA